MSVCKVSWCIALPAPNDHLCRQHRAVPLVHSHETQAEYFMRIRGANAARRREEQKQREQVNEANAAWRARNAAARQRLEQAGQDDTED